MRGGVAPDTGVLGEAGRGGGGQAAVVGMVTSAQVVPGTPAVASMVVMVPRLQEAVAPCRLLAALRMRQLAHVGVAVVRRDGRSRGARRGRGRGRAVVVVLERELKWKHNFHFSFFYKHLLTSRLSLLNMIQTMRLGKYGFNVD